MNDSWVSIEREITDVGGEQVVISARTASLHRLSDTVAADGVNVTVTYGPQDDDLPRQATPVQSVTTTLTGFLSENLGLESGPLTTATRSLASLVPKRTSGVRLALPGIDHAAVPVQYLVPTLPSLYDDPALIDAHVFALTASALGGIVQRAVEAECGKLRSDSGVLIGPYADPAALLESIAGYRREYRF